MMKIKIAFLQLKKVIFKKAPFMNHKCKAELIKKVAAGRFNEVTVDDFVDTNPNHPRRRIADYIMFKEDVYMQHVNNCSYNDRFLDKNIASENWNTCYEYLVLAQASPIFHSSCEGKLGIALE